MRNEAIADFEKMERDATNVFAREEKKASEAVIKLNKISKDFAKLHVGLIDKASLAGVNKMNKNLDKLLAESSLDDDTKKEIKQSANDAAKGDPKKFENSVESSVKKQQAEKETVVKKVGKRRAAFQKGITKAKAGVKKYGSAASVAKASRAAAAGARALNKFLTAKKPDGTLDPVKVVGGVIDYSLICTSTNKHHYRYSSNLCSPDNLS